MVDSLNPLGVSPIQPGSVGGAGKTDPAEGDRSFKQILEDAISHVSELQQDADLTLEKLYKGEAPVEQAMVAYKKAQVAFETLMQIRNKLMAAFEDIQRMRI